MNSIAWHQRTVADVLAALHTSPQGVSADEALRRLAEHGPNELRETKKHGPVMMFVSQFRDFLIIVLLAAAVVAGIVGDLKDTLAIIVIVILNAVIGFVQEYRAEKSLDALKRIAALSATVLRNGSPATVPASALVPGDVVLLDAGRIVPADLRLIEAARLDIEEAALTGESVPVGKNTDPLGEGALSLGDRLNMAYKGSIVSFGRGAGVVVATGMQTEIGRIATMLQEEETVKTPLQKRLAAFGRKLALAILVICAIVFVSGILRGEQPVVMLLTAISLAVAAIPEALPAVVTISLAIGARKLVRENALIRKLPAVETLGSVTYICTDKTGTLTLNRMTVEELYLDGRAVRIEGLVQEAAPAWDASALSVLLTALSVSNDILRDGAGGAVGDPTEAALLELAERQGFAKQRLEGLLPRIAEIPFDAGRKCMTTLHRLPDGTFVSFTKGAVDVLIDRVSAEPRFDSASVLRESSRMASEGLRVLCICMRRWDSMPDTLTPDTLEQALVFVGLTGMMDPPRPEAAEAVRQCREAGIKPVMITGDHPLTAAVIARRIGIIGEGEGVESGAVLTGMALDSMPMEEFERRVPDIRVYARVAPEQKLRIVKALQDRGQYVAMTGDGVNDAPALKRADIGVAMGITGTDVAKETAHMILLDDNFATIVKAVREGRKIYDNIRKFIRYLLSSNAAEVLTLFLAPFLGLPLPLLPIHILWINLITDSLPALALAFEPGGTTVMQRPPRPPGESIFAHGLGTYCLWAGLLMAGVTLVTQAGCINAGNPAWQTMVFTVLAISQLANALAVRTERESVLSSAFFSNPRLLGAIGITFALQLAVIYLPVMNDIFSTMPLTAAELALTLGLGSVVFFLVELEKLARRKGWPRFLSSRISRT